NHHESQHQALSFRLDLERNKVGHWIADHQAEDGSDNRHDQRTPVNLDVNRIHRPDVIRYPLHGGNVIAEVIDGGDSTIGIPLGKAVEEHDEKRKQEKDDESGEREKDQRIRLKCRKAAKYTKQSFCHEVSRMTVWLGSQER